MPNEFPHRCPQDGKKRCLETTLDRDAEWYKGYCGICDSYRYFESDGKEVTPA